MGSGCQHISKLDQVGFLHRLQQFSMGRTVLDRRHIVPQATGDVMEIGIGGGQNIPFYRAENVRSLVGVDQSPKTERIHRLAENLPFQVDVLVEKPEGLSYPNESVDCVVSTYALCSVNDPTLALDEIRRVLRPGGLLLFCEQGRHPSRSVALLQDKISPLWKRLTRGKSLNRNMFRLIAGAGFNLDFFEMERLPLKPLIFGYHYAGIAVKI